MPISGSAWQSPRQRSLPSENPSLKMQWWISVEHGELSLPDLEVYSILACAFQPLGLKLKSLPRYHDTRIYMSKISILEEAVKSYLFFTREFVLFSTLGLCNLRTAAWKLWGKKIDFRHLRINALSFSPWFILHNAKTLWKVGCRTGTKRKPWHPYYFLKYLMYQCWSLCLSMACPYKAQIPPVR